MTKWDLFQQYKSCSTNKNQSLQNIINRINRKHTQPSISINGKKFDKIQHNFIYKVTFNKQGIEGNFLKMINSL